MTATCHEVPESLQALLGLCVENAELAAFSAPREADGNCGLAVDIFTELAERVLPETVIGEVHFVAPSQLRTERSTWTVLSYSTEVYSYRQAPHRWYLSGCRWTGHVVARAGEWLIDWTARQFDPSAPFPLVFRMSPIR